MNKLALISATSLLAATVATFAHGSGYSSSGTEEPKIDPHVEIIKAECMTGDGAGMQANCLSGAGAMIGEVDEIDYVNGTILLNHGGSRILLNFAPAAIIDIKHGDTVAIPVGPAD